MSENTSLVIRHFEPNDTPTLLQILEEMGDERYPGLAAGKTAATRQAWLEKRASLNHWVALRDHEVIGQIQVVAPDESLEELLENEPTQIFEVSRFFVAKNQRTHGTGRALLESAVSCIQSHGATPVLRVPSYLTPAITLFRRSGWVQLGEITSTTTQDPLLVFLAP